MLSNKDNDILCRVGPGTPMGDVMRQYWLPALTSSELPGPDSEPLRLRLLAENLIAFRATSGKTDIVADACPHRGASLFFGRNEEEGLRCVYHGWKFDTTGACVDMPSEPTESNFKSKVRARSYPCVERNGIIWTYMGPRSEPPELPQLEVNMLAGGEVVANKILRDCNWMQALEGDIDTSHLSFLHLGAVKPEDAVPGSFDYYGVRDRAPKYDVLETEFGTTYGAYRPAEADTYYWRIANFLFPFYTMIPTGTLGIAVHVRAWVPVDDEHVMFWGISMPRTRNVGRGGQEASERNAASGRPGAAGSNGAQAAGQQYEPFTTGWLGRWRLNQNASNDYGIDREAQRSGVNYTGINGIFQQDQAVTESMGSVYQRSHEHLGTSDAMIIRTRRRAINIARALREHGTTPPGVDNPEVYRTRSGSVILPRSANWLQATEAARWPTVEYGAPVNNVGV
ncbi:MAG TPA: Rieske 2Fe-2S domain-containing protein [Dehalococcoidia bacterium]|nr:Rieske 2Fe-2S domain-containing protein [Dehalococcoidia bacterium]